MILLIYSDIIYFTDSTLKIKNEGITSSTVYRRSPFPTEGEGL